MRQLLQNLKTGATTIEEVPVPEVRAGFALVRTAASLISAGTERMLVDFGARTLVGKARARPDLVRQAVQKARREGWASTARGALNRLDQPMALGYSSSGTIADLGGDMHGWRVGQRVACAGAGFAVHAEYALVPRNLLAPLPTGVGFESGAFATVGAIAMHGIRLAEPQVGERVAIIGLGLVGLVAAQIAAAAGCTVLGVDLDARRVDLARQLGLQAVRRKGAEAAGRAITDGRGFDSVVICADTPSADPVHLAATLARDRARVVAVGAVGLELPRKPYYDKELTLVNARSSGPGRYDATYEQHGVDYPAGYVRWTQGRNLAAVLDLVASGKLKVKPLITHRFPIGGAPEAYRLLTQQRRTHYLGIVLTYDTPRRAPARRVALRSRPASPSKTVRLGVIGAGNFADAVLMPAIKAVRAVELVGIASTGGLHAAHAGRKFGFSFAAADPDEILKDKRINTVAILTRHDSHAELVARALRAGKHVFVEKPLALNEPQLSVVISALKSHARRGGSPRSGTVADGILAVGFNRRFAPLASRLREFLQDRREPLFGHYRVNAGYLPPDHWTQDPQSGGGRIIGEACHFIDFLTFLVGAPPSTVTARALPDSGRYREDNVTITCAFPDGSVGVVDYLANGDRLVSKERLEVFCGGHVAILDDFRSLELVADGKRATIRLPQDKGWTNEWKAFVAAIMGGGPPPIPYEQLVLVTRATFAAVAALRQSA